MLFRNNPQAGLKKAEAALAGCQAKIAELQSARTTALAEADDVASVHDLDRQIEDQRKAAATYSDRIAVLKAAVAEQQAAEHQKQYAAALAEIEKRLVGQVELAGKVEQAARDLGQHWNQLLNWRSAIVSGWPAELPLPPADAFVDIGPLRRELSVLLYSIGEPKWDRPSSIPAPAQPFTVQGLEPKGVASYVDGAGKAFIARLRSQAIKPIQDESEAA
jgi:hypothetical protein